MEAPLTEESGRGIENPDKINGSSNAYSADQSKTPDVVKLGVQGKAKLTGFQFPNPPVIMNEEQFTSATAVHTSILGDSSILSSQVVQLKDAQVMVTTRMETLKGETIEIRQATEEEQELARIYNLLGITPHPLGTRKSVGPPKIPPEKSQR